MIQSFEDEGTEAIFDGADTKAARRTLPPELHGAARRRLDYLDRATSLRDIRAIPGYGLHKLAGDRAAQWAVRINDQYRICFFWDEEGPAEVEIVDYH